MVLGASPDRRTGVRLSACQEVTLFLEDASLEVTAEVVDVSPSGFRIRHSHSVLAPDMTVSFNNSTNGKGFHVVWTRNAGTLWEAGLLSDEAYQIRRVCSGDGELLMELVKPHMRGLRAVVFSIVHNHADTEDVVQEAMLKALAHIHQFHPGQSFRAWLLQIATNEAFKLVRKNRKHHSSGWILPDDDAEKLLAGLVDPHASPAEKLERKEFEKALAAALTSLGEIYRKVFVLRHVDELGVAEVAARLGINVATANTRLHRARLQMRDGLQQIYTNRL